jgi:hypothetical protein
MACWLLLALAACGGRDVTTLTSEGEAAEDPGADDSRVFDVLERPESLDALCRVIGVSVAGGGPGCAGVVESCREGLGGALLDRPAQTLPSGDLAPLFNCPLTVAQLDGCIASVLERGVAAYGGDVGCGQPALPEVDTFTLFASPECLAVALFCPDLAASLGGGGG